MTWQAILSTSALFALRFENGSIALVCCAFFLSFLASTFLFQLEVRKICTMTGLVLSGWMVRCSCEGSIVDDNDRLAATQEAQTAHSPGKALVRYGSRVDDRCLHLGLCG